LKSGSGRWDDQRTEEIGNPGRGMPEVFQNARTIRVADMAADCRQHGLVHLVLAEMAEGLDQGSLLRPAVAMFRGVVYWRRISRFPIFTFRAGPSVRKTMREGTCSESPSTFAA